MAVISPHTAPTSERMQIDHLRRPPASGKLALVREINRTVRAMAMAGLRQRRPDDTLERRRRRLATSLLGSELAARVHGPASRHSPVIAAAGGRRCIAARCAARNSVACRWTPPS